MTDLLIEGAGRRSGTPAAQSAGNRRSSRAAGATGGNRRTARAGAAPATTRARANAAPTAANYAANPRGFRLSPVGRTTAEQLRRTARGRARLVERGSRTYQVNRRA